MDLRGGVRRQAVGDVLHRSEDSAELTGKGMDDGEADAYSEARAEAFSQAQRDAYLMLVAGGSILPSSRSTKLEAQQPETRPVPIAFNI